VGQLRASAGKRAVGTRDRVMSHLAAAGEIRDPGGMASAALARAVGYPGSSVAFAQLLSAMERSGLIEREIQGKRTYRIAARPGRPAAPRGLPSPQAAAPAAGAGRDRAGSRAEAAGSGGLTAAAGSSVGFDYDELARSLLAQVLRGAVMASPGGGHPVFPAAAAGPGPGAEPGEAGDQQRALREVVARLEGELATVRTRQRRLTEENARLREQIQQARQSLAAVQQRASRGPGGGLTSPEAAVLIERLLNPVREPGSQRPEAGAG
jgi:hypothetical protein